MKERIQAFLQRFKPVAQGATARAISSFGWSTSSYAIAQLLRFSSNLILARLLAPEMFGVMAIVNVVFLAIGMFTDAGLSQTLVRHPLARQERFANTIWTMQICRGLLLMVVCGLISWPISQFYRQPDLFPLIAAMGTVALISGFQSTKITFHLRDQSLRPIVIIDVAAQFASTVLMIAVAFAWRSVWVFILGALFSSLIKTYLSHYSLRGISDQLYWDKGVVGEVYRFGRWIFLSTILTFITGSAASLILGRLAPIEIVGIFAIAVTLVKFIENAYALVSEQVVFPLYSQWQSLDLQELKRRITITRSVLLLIFIPPLLFLAVLSPWVVSILFDSRYTQAGWIMQIYAVGMLPSILTGVGHAYLSRGRSDLVSYLSLARAIVFSLSAAIGYIVMGVPGVIIGMGCYAYLMYPVDLLVQRYFGIQCVALDVSVFIIWGASLGVLWSLMGMWPRF